MKPTPQELEQEALLKNFLDGLEPLEAEKTRSALRGVSSLPTVEEEYLESFPDPSTDTFDVDRPEWILAENLNLGLEEATRVLEWHQVAVAREVDWAKAEQLNLIVSFLIKPTKNLRALVRALALATGLAELNGTHSQAEVARELNVTRALISYYVTTWADLLKINVFKFRKASSSREIYREAAKTSWAKRKA
jgi:hypothetical protein